MGGRWEDWPPARPIRVDGGIRARSKRGAIGEQWWSRRFWVDVPLVLFLPAQRHIDPVAYHPGEGEAAETMVTSAGAR